MTIENIAQKIYATDTSDPGYKIPRHKFNFTLILHRTGAQSQIFHQVMSATLPNYTFENETLNQYNRRRIIQKQLQYGTMQVTFFDTYDNAWQRIMSDYAKHYYNGGNGLDQRTEMSNPDDSTVDSFTTGLGFVANNKRHFFSKVSIIQNGYRRGHREIMAHFPTITEIQHDTLAHSESQPVVYQVTFQPEYIQITENPGRFDDGI